jgi:hypothetical protein
MEIANPKAPVKRTVNLIKQLWRSSWRVRRARLSGCPSSPRRWDCHSGSLPLTVVTTLPIKRPLATGHQANVAPRPYERNDAAGRQS